MAVSTKFRIKLGATVAINLTDYNGQVIGRTEYLDHPPSYFVRFRSAKGDQRQDWFSPDAIRDLSADAEKPSDGE